ncbi:hypothetical protein [Rhodococcus sp. MEB041]|uniref:hypothetical protein n=1 Tax=Rhodococcus sp. MEB041 TaxID=3040323 RepID=UPI002551BF34|nr:hypothetical protein [Rhodococcus sp. MEB041]
MIDDIVVGTVRIEWIGTPFPLDDMIVDRMVLTPAHIVQPRRALADAEHLPAGTTTRTVAISISLPAPAATAHRLVGTASSPTTRPRLPVRSSMRPTSVLGDLLAGEHPPDHDNVADLVRIRTLDDIYNGAELVSTLEVYRDSGTLRSAAGLVNLHHSSVAHRLTTLSRHLGFAVDLPENRARTEAWMMVHRMRTREGYPHARRPN